MTELIKISPAAGPYINLVWQVSDLCNFRCPYCSEFNWGGRYKNLEFEKIEPGLKKIFKHYKKLGYENYKIFFSGGEPTLWNPLEKVIDLCSKELPKVKFAINTNLSRDISWWMRNSSLFDDIVCSFHIEGADQKRFIETYKMLSEKTNYCVARMMMQENRFDEVLEFAENLKNEVPRYKIEYVPLFRELSNTTEPWEYKNSAHRDFLTTHGFERAKFEDVSPRSRAETTSKEIYSDGTERVLNSNRLVAERKNFFSGWKCKTQESVFINPQGDLTMATCGQSPSIGNLYSDEFEIPDEPITCQKLQCHCGTDIVISKEKG